MSQIDPRSTVGQLVTERPSRARVFERYGIDFCCGGGVALAEACARLGLDPAFVARELEEAELPAPSEDVQAMGLASLCDHIERRHHDFLRRELPRLQSLAEKVASVHGASHPELVELLRVFSGFRAELQQHMAKEEQILFPALRAMERDGARGFPVAMPISCMEREHDEAAAALHTMRDLTRGFVAPQDACRSYIALFDGLAELEADMHRHVHKENNVLFPRALALQEEAVPGRCGG